MTRLRVTLLLLAFGIAVPAGLIVLRALESVALENAFQHEAVARRVFDEMERALSDFLVREEGRAVEDFDTGDAARFAAADEPFVLGWFALDSLGKARVVHARGDAARVAAAVTDAWGAPGAASELDESIPAPGRTRRVGKKGEAEPLVKDLIGEKESRTAYDVLSRLNVAQQRRDERQSKLRQAQPPARSRTSARGLDRSDRVPAVQEAEALAFEPAAAEAASAFDDPDAARASAPRSEALGSLQESVEREARADRAASAPPPSVVAAARPPPALRRETPAVDPLIGRTARDGRLVLVRSVWRGGGAERQGVVVDRDALALWLERRVLEETGLEDQARVDFGAPTLPEREAARHRYVHRFAEPFDALIARLDLEPLPGLGSSQPVYLLAGLLAAVALVGLLAVQRGARVVVDYAQRRSDFVASVSHELKTPLTAIRMYGEMLRDGLVGSERKREEYYATIADESERLSRLIDNVLEFSRLEQDQRPLELVLGSLDGALRDAAEKLRTHVEREGFALRLELDEGLPAVRYDRDAVTQVVFNLVDNALKYARSSDRRDVVLALCKSERGVSLCVRDYGPGVPARTLRRVFEPFYRGGDELTRTAKGTGIGLALVRELALAMGASVRGSNPTGGGFEVAVDFPAQPA